MVLNRLLIVAMGLCVLICKPALSQDEGTGIDKAINFPSSFFNKLNKTTTNLEARLTKQTERYLERLPGANKNYNENFPKSTAMLRNNCLQAARNNTGN